MFKHHNDVQVLNLVYHVKSACLCVHEASGKSSYRETESRLVVAGTGVGSNDELKLSWFSRVVEACQYWIVLLVNSSIK